MKSKIISSTSFLLTGVALAQSSVFNQLPSETEINMTGARLPTQSRSQASDVRVIKRAAIEAATGESLPEILQRRAGVQFVQSEGSSDAIAYLRGSNGNQVLLLIDGMRVNSVATGAANWNIVALANVERIEVLQGPASAIYGSDAVGGVVQVFTRKNVLGSTQNVALTLGPKYKQAAASIAGGDQNGIYYNLGISQTNDDRRKGEELIQAASDLMRSQQSVKQTMANGGITIRVNDNWSAGATVVRSTRSVDYVEGMSQQNARLEQNTDSAKIYAQAQLSQSWTSKLTLAEIKDKNNIVGGSQPSQLEGSRSVQTWENHILIPNGNVTIGMERSKESLQTGGANTLIFGQAPARKTDSIFGAYSAQVDGANITLNARQDKTPEFDTMQSFSAGYSVQSNPNTRFFASTGTAYAVPSLKQKFATPYANAALMPEKTRSTQLGIEWQDDTRFGSSLAKAVIYRNMVDNKIIAPEYYVPTNINKARIQGLSLAYKTKTGPLEFGAQYDRVDARDEATGNPLPRSAKNMLSMNADYRTGPWKLGAEVLHVGAQSDLYYNLSNNQSIESIIDAANYLNLNAEYAVQPDWSLQFRVNNATNANRQAANGALLNPRAYQLTLRYQPQK